MSRIRELLPEGDEILYGCGARGRVLGRGSKRAKTAKAAFSITIGLQRVQGNGT